MDELWDKIKAWFAQNKWACILGAAGVLYVLLWFAIGFWRTILLTIIAAVCIFMGHIIDRSKNKDDE